MDFEFITPPNAKEIERAVLGEIVFDMEALDMAIEDLEENSFYQPVHGILFSTIKNLRIENQPIDQITLTEELIKTGKLDMIGGEASLIGIIGEYISSANIKAHIEILKEKHRKRRLIALTTAARSLCYEESSDPDEIATMLYLQTVDILDRKKETPYRVLSDITSDAYAWIMQKANQKGTMGISTGISMLDKYTDGWQPGRLYLLAGKTGEGKSSLATNSFALNAAKKGISTGIFSLEMGDIEIGVRLIQSESRYDVSDIQYKNPTQDDWGRISAACNTLHSLPIVIDETPGISIGQIGSKIRRMQRDKSIKLVIVDYLQLMEGKMTKTREQEVATISRGLKLLSKSLHIPIIAISQFSRKADESDTAEPQLSWLRESGALEQDADTVIFIHNAVDKVKKEYKIDGNKENIREIIIRKNRGGKTGKIFATWIPEHITFYDIEY